MPNKNNKSPAKNETPCVIQNYKTIPWHPVNRIIPLLLQAVLRFWERNNIFWKNNYYVIWRELLRFRERRYYVIGREVLRFWERTITFSGELPIHKYIKYNSVVVVLFEIIFSGLPKAFHQSLSKQNKCSGEVRGW